MTPITLHLDDQLMERLHTIATHEQKPVEEVAVFALEAGLEDERVDVIGDYDPAHDPLLMLIELSEQLVPLSDRDDIAN